MLYRTAVFDEKMILKQAEQQARMLYKQILLTRQWAADHNGLFVLERQGVEANPYLELPVVTDALGQSYFLRNPAMITRELSAYAQKGGLGQFRVTSLKPVNPDNRPDAFETKALEAFAAGADEIIDVEEAKTGRVVRFIAPMRVNESCLAAMPGTVTPWAISAAGCRSPSHRLGGRADRKEHPFADVHRHNQHPDRHRGALPDVRIAHRPPDRRLSQAMDSFPEDPPEQYLLPSLIRDELDSVSDTFVLFCDRLKKSQDELLQTRAQTHLSEKMASLGILTAGIAHESTTRSAGCSTASNRCARIPTTGNWSNATCPSSTRA